MLKLIVLDSIINTTITSLPTLVRALGEYPAGADGIVAIIVSAGAVSCAIIRQVRA